MLLRRASSILAIVLLLGGADLVVAELRVAVLGLVDGVVDFSRVNPILFVMNDRSYWQIGERFAKAWQAGKALR